MRFFALIFAGLLALAVPAQWLPVDTAVVVTVGPLIDDTDFKTLETAIAYNAAGMSVDLIQSSGAATTKTDLTLTTGSTQDWTHVGNGVYEIEITSLQNGTEGNLQVVGVADGVLPFFSPVYTVVPALVYNSLVGGTDTLEVDTVQVEGVDATDAINAAADSLEAIRIQGDAAWGGGGAGNTPVNHDTGGAGALKYVDGDGAGIEGAIIQAYVKSEYDAGTFTVRGQTTTKADGTWTANLMLNEGVAYTLVFYKPGAFGPNTVDVTP